MIAEIPADIRSFKGRTWRQASVSELSPIIHWLTALVISGLVLAVLYGALSRPMGSSDGVNYAQIARNVSEGKGIVSSVIQPGLVDVVPTTTAGQAFVIQQPLWPWVLGQWFRVFGVSQAAFNSLNFILYLVTLSSTWWLTYRLSRSIPAAHFGLAMAGLNPWILGATFGGVTVPLQGAIITSIFLALTFPFGVWSVGAVAALMAAAILARENSIFILVACFFVWLLAVRREIVGAKLRTFPWKTVLPWVLGFAGVVAITLAAYGLETSRKAGLLGRWDAPVLRLTFLYYTPLNVEGWTAILHDPSLNVDPVSYYREHPGVLWDKMVFQFREGFIPRGAREGGLLLLGLLSYTAVFVPVVIPWLVRTKTGRAVSVALLLVLATQIVMGTMTFLHFTYFLAFLPAVSAVVAAGLPTLVARAWANLRTRSPLRWALGLTFGAVGLYAVLPTAANAAHLAVRDPILQGDYYLTPHQEASLAFFVSTHTPREVLVGASHSPLMAWDTGRAIMQYSANPLYHIGDNDMWRQLQVLVPMDYILFNSLAGDDPKTPMLPGFQLYASLEQPDIKAWLFKRDDAAPPPARTRADAIEKGPSETAEVYRQRLRLMAASADMPLYPSTDLIDRLVRAEVFKDS